MVSHAFEALTPIYSLATSTAGWDTARAVTTSIAIILEGPAILAAFRGGENQTLKWQAGKAVDGGNLPPSAASVTKG